MPSIATMARTVGALVARRARRWSRLRSRCRAPSGPLWLDGCLALSNDAYGSVHRRGRHGSTGASLMLSTAKMARTIGTDAARWGRRPARRRPQRLAPTDPLWLDGRTVGRCHGHDGAHRRGPCGSTGALLMPSTATMAHTVGADAARQAHRQCCRWPRWRTPSRRTRLSEGDVRRGDGHDSAHRRGPRGSTGALLVAATATTTRTVRALVARRARCWSRRRPRRRAPSRPLGLDGCVIARGDGHAVAHRRGPSGSTGASLLPSIATPSRTVGADEA